MEQKQAQDLAAGILKIRLENKGHELSGVIKRSKAIHGRIRRIAAKRVKNSFARYALKLTDSFLRWVIKKLGERARALVAERQKIKKALGGLAAGQPNPAIEILEEGFLRSGAMTDHGVFQEIFHDVWFIDLISTLKGEGK